MGAKISLIGNIYGRLTVISQSDLRYKDNKIKYNCQCICGNEIIVGAANLKKGNVKSCGCILKEFHNYKFNNNINIDDSKKDFASDYLNKLQSVSTKINKPAN